MTPTAGRVLQAHLRVHRAGLLRVMGGVDGGASRPQAPEAVDRQAGTWEGRRPAVLSAGGQPRGAAGTCCRLGQHPFCGCQLPCSQAALSLPCPRQVFTAVLMHYTRDQLPFTMFADSKVPNDIWGKNNGAPGWGAWAGLLHSGAENRGVERCYSATASGWKGRPRAASAAVARLNLAAPAAVLCLRRRGSHAHLAQPAGGGLRGQGVLWQARPAARLLREQIAD